MFDKEKDWILKLVNLILILWLIGSLIFFYTSVVDVLIEEKPMPYNLYKQKHCEYLDDEVECQRMFDSSKEYDRDFNNRKKRDIFISIGNVALVSTTIKILNKRRNKDETI